MKCHSSITLDSLTIEEKNALVKLFSVEDTVLSNGRGSYTMSVTDTSLFFQIEADDLVALRAMVASVTKVLGIYGKVGTVLQHHVNKNDK